MKRKSTKRSNGEGTIIYESDRQKYRAFLTDPLGKRISKRFNSNAEALQWLAETRADIYRDEYIPTNDITFGEWWLRFIQTYKKGIVSQTTYEQLLNISNKLIPLANYQLQEMTQPLMQDFFKGLDLAPSSKHNYAIYVKECFAKAIELSILKTSPMKGVKLPPIKLPPIEIYKREEIDKLFYQINSKKATRKYYVLFLLLFASGVRIGEALALKIQNVYNDHIYIESAIKNVSNKLIDGDTKNYKTRNIALPKYVIEELRNCHKNDNCSYIFHTKNNTPYRERSIIRVWTNIQCNANIPYRNLHAIRHTHITHLISSGVPINEVARRAGHTVETMIKRYAHFINTYDREMVNKVNDILPLHPYCSRDTENGVRLLNINNILVNAILKTN